MRRREFITGASSLLSFWPLAARAQQVSKLPTIGYLGPNVEPVDRPRIAAFAQRLGELGWIEGRSVIIERRAADGLVERAVEIASEFVRLKVNVILTSGDSQGLAAKQSTKTIPIVVAIIGDPVGSGLVATLARPGANLTGLSMVAADTAGKRLEILREAFPSLRRLAILAHVANPGTALEFEAVQAAAHKLAASLSPAGGILPAMLALGLDRAGGGIARPGASACAQEDPRRFFFRKNGIPFRAANRIDFGSIAGCRAGVNIGIVRSTRKE
jgi:putative tryptophan/tyrosine transport system substrate-binding protein